MVSGKGTVCDVGTDHAYLPAYLVLNGICKKAVAGDIAEGPLEAARATVEKYGLSDRIDIVLSDGLENVEYQGITDVIIAGMGAETICSIIERAPWLKNGVNLILQPMTKHPLMRKWLYLNGYEIVREEAVPDNEFIYTVMNVRYSGVKLEINETAENAGRFDFSDENAVLYARRQIKRLRDVSEGIKLSGKNDIQAEKIGRTADSIESLIDPENVVNAGMIYDEINRISSFSTQESWDNSGLIVGDRENRVTKILVALDITHKVIDEAIAKKADMIISHHPVIFRAVKNLSAKNPAVRLAMNGISAVCVHTPVDMASNGINDIIADMITEKYPSSAKRVPIEPLSSGSCEGMGRIIELDQAADSDEFAASLKKMFGCTVLRYTRGKGKVRNIGICSGSGGSLLGECVAAGCDCLVTGDVKHDVWIDAVNCDIALFDCGHYHTERIVVKYIASVLRACTYGIDIEESEADTDCVCYASEDKE